MKRAAFSAGFLALMLIAASTLSAEPTAAPQILRDDAFKTGKIRFVPVLTITDATMAGKGFFSMPYDIAVDGQGCVYVTDAQENHIKVFDASGVFLKTIGRKGQGPGEFRMLMEVETSKDRICAGEGGRISFFDSKGAFLSSSQIVKGSSWRAMKALPDGRFLVEKQIVDYERRQDPFRGEETQLDLHSPEMEYLKTLYRRAIPRHKYIEEPTFTGLALPFAPNLSWDIRPDGQVAIGFSGDYEVEIYDPDRGKAGSFRHEFAPLDVTKADRDFFFAGISYVVQSENAPPVVKKGAPEYMRKATDFPRFKPPFTQIKADAQGRIWVRRSAPLAREAHPPYDILGADGRFIGQVEIEGPDLHPRALPWAGGFWMVRQTEGGEFEIVKYAVEAVK